jgi:hypothetical protein
MTALSTKSVGQHTATSPAHENMTDQTHEVQIENKKIRPLKQKNLRVAQAAEDAAMG